MPTLKPVQIVGGGLAGLTLGIGLRQRDVPVVIHEAGNYPRHRVCGEFISGRGQEIMARLGLRGQLENAGAIPAQTAAFFTATQSATPRSLPSSALCLSRFTLDQLLAAEFLKLGGELHVNTRWPSASVQVRIGSDQRKPELQPEGVVHATGRRLQPKPGSERWFGLKVHASNVPLTADLEMHLSRRGYVGLCNINGGKVNVCGIFRRREGENFSGEAALDWLRGQTGSLLRERLATAEFDEDSFCAVAGLSLRPQSAAGRQETSVGDSITMIPPVTGNGMSMAFESAELAISPLAAWSRREISWLATKSHIACACDKQFSSRLRWAKWLQHFMLTPQLQNPLVTLVARSDRFWRLAFEHTR